MAALVKNIAESINIKDERRDNSRSVVSDIFVGNTDIDQAAFDAILSNGSAVGYESFRNFIGGDYEYSKVLFKGVVNSGTSDAARITSLTMDVDVPDILDKGNAVTSAGAPITVTLNRSFYSVTEVSATLKGGTIVAVPRVSNIRTISGISYFDVELIDVNGNRIVGTVSWSAKGY